VGLFDSVDKLQKGSSGGAPFLNPKPSILTCASCNPDLLLLKQSASLESVPHPTVGCRSSNQSTVLPPGLSNPSLSSLGGFKDPTDQLQSVSSCRKMWKANKNAKRLVLGNDVGLKDTCGMALCYIVGRLSYKSLSKGSLLYCRSFIL
jgi:hypothetical protein